MRVMTAGAAILIGVLAAGTVTAAPQTLQFTMTTVTDAQGMHMNVEAKIWVKGQKARVETNSPFTGQVLMLTDGTTVRYLYPQQKRGTVTTLNPGPHGPRNPWELVIGSVSELTHGAKKQGEEKLGGYSCDVYELTRRSPSQSQIVKSWITRTTQPRLPLKVEISAHVKRPNMTVNQTQTTRITGLKIGMPLPNSLFAVPPGYKIVQSNGPGLPGLRGAPGPSPAGPRP
jgi:hypothetical protein